MNCWRPENWDNLYINVKDGTMRDSAFEEGADEMHHADVKWLIQKLIHDDRGYVLKMNNEEWQSFIKDSI